jgi:MraZ protein
MFLGQYQHTLDNKGRLTIPARYRDLLDDGAYLTQGFDRNLMVMTVSAFEALSRKVNSMSITDSRARLLRRLLFSNGERVEVDKAGRILIPQFLRQSASLDSDAIVVGGGDYFEIWSPGHWAEQAVRLNDAEANADLFSIFDISAE